MKLKLIAALLVLFLLAVVVSGGVAFYLLTRTEMVPLVNAGGGKAPAPLPKDAVVLTASDGAEVVAPFQIHDEPGAVGGVAAFMPKGSRTEEHKGKVLFKFKVEEAGTYHGFVHAKWRDTCSNSCGLKVNQGTEFTAGNDDVFSVWHWVPAGKHKLDAGENTASLVEREDGIFVDQILFTKETGYVPTGAISAAGVTREIRRFADTFSRSPGHGNEGWSFEGKGKFDIAFSFDPNRIPNQYALTGNAATGPCTAFVKDTAWYGCKMSYTFQPTSDGVYGCVTDVSPDSLIFAGFSIQGGKAQAFIRNGISQPVKSGDINLRLNQWHRVIVERWAWITRIWVDGVEVCVSREFNSKTGRAGLYVESGTAVFDDFEIEEVPWQADDGANLKIDWTSLGEAKWFRNSAEKGGALKGESGTIKAGLGGIPLEEIVIQEETGGAENIAKKSVVEVNAPGLKQVYEQNGAREFRLPPLADGSGTHAEFSAVAPGASMQRVALRFGRRTPAVFNVGPYTFSESELEDPSDYLDFTEEEYRAMARSPEAQKLQRHAKMKPVITHGGSEESGSWIYMGGEWNINTRTGCLTGRGYRAQLRHAQEISSDMELRFKIRIYPQSTAEVEMYSGAGTGVRVQFAPPAAPSAKPAKPSPATPAPAATFETQANGQWHEVSLRVDGSKLFAKLDREPLREIAINRGVGDRTLLKIVQGSADFDDVEFIVQRVTEKSVLYGFNQPEPDWWREPSDKWVDHGGIACVLASSWISLVAPDSAAIMWNKRKFATDALVAFNVEENSEWYGWDKWPNHTHFPFDNIETTLASESDPVVNYKLIVNGEQHTVTSIQRNGKEVARIRQDRNFPMRFVGSHMPFMPRTNRISFVKRGAVLQGIVNGLKVIEYTDPEPLTVSRVGVGGHDTRVNFSHIEIMSLDATPKVSEAVPASVPKTAPKSGEKDF